MNEETPLQSPNVINRAWLVFKRLLAVVVILIATVAFLANAVGLISVWAARRPARNTVTGLSTFVNSKLEIVDQALTRVGARADEGRQAVARLNDTASKLGDRPEERAQLLTALTNTVRDDLAPKIAEARSQAITLHDGVVSVNAALETLNGLGFITVPTLTDELNAVSDRIDAIRSAVQELRTAIDEARPETLQNLVAAVTTRTAKIDNGLAQIKSTAVKYQEAVAQKQQRVTERSHTLLRAINLLVLSPSALFLVVAAGQVLLIYVCWQYVCRGRFSSLRVVRVDLAPP